MKKTLLTFAIALASFLGINMQATAQTTKTFTDYLIVAVNGESTDPQKTDIVVTVREDGLMDFNLKNFSLANKEIGSDDEDNPIIVNSALPIGNISLEGLTLTPIEGTNNFTFTADESIQISEGDLEGVDMWMGPYLGDIPLKLNGEICNEKLYVAIDIDMMEVIGQIINVHVGTPIDDTPLSTTAKTYTDYLIVSVNGESTDPQAADIVVSLNEEGKMNFNLKNFSLANKEIGSDDDDNPIIVNSALPIGNISLEGLTLTPIEGTNAFSFTADESIQISEGDLEGVDMWMGPYLGDIPLKLNGIISDKKLYVSIDIDMMEVIGQVIVVKVGTPFDDTILFPEEPAVFTLSFNVDGETISTQELEEGAAITVPEVEEREGYTFVWNEEIPETMPADNVEITGQYVANKYQVSFIVDGNSIYQESLEYGSEIKVPEVEEREGYTFAWDQEIPATVPAGDVTINGTYTVNYYTCTWMLNGYVYLETTIAYGEAIPELTIEGNERYTFSGWDEVPATMPAHDVVINGSLVDGMTGIRTNILGAQYGYNIAGMRVNAKNTRGIVIVNGKKILKR